MCELILSISSALKSKKDFKYFKGNSDSKNILNIVDKHNYITTFFI